MRADRGAGQALFTGRFAGPPADSAWSGTAEGDHHRERKRPGPIGFPTAPGLGFDAPAGLRYGGPRVPPYGDDFPPLPPRPVPLTRRTSAGVSQQAPSPAERRRGRLLLTFIGAGSRLRQVSVRNHGNAPTETPLRPPSRPSAFAPVLARFLTAAQPGSLAQARPGSLASGRIRLAQFPESAPEPSGRPTFASIVLVPSTPLSSSLLV